MADDTAATPEKKARTVGDLVIQVKLDAKYGDVEGWVDQVNGPLAKVPNTIKKQNRLIAEKGAVDDTYRVIRAFKPVTVKEKKQRTLV